MHRHLIWMIRTIATSFAAVIAPHVQAANGVVGPGNCNDAGFSSVLATVDGSGGGTITFNCGTATITFAGYKQVSNAVVIDGGGAVTFDGGNSSGFFQSFFSATLVLKRLTLQHSVYTGGVRALENFGTLVLDHVKVVNNVSTRGPVLSSGTLFVRSSTFSGNSASSGTDGDGGAIENSSGDLDIDSSTFNGNTAARHGGAIYSGSSMTIVNSTFDSNTALAGGGIYQDGSGNSSIASSTIIGNTGTSFSGGVYNDGAGNATLTVSRSAIIDNINGNCDGVLVSGGYNLWHGTTTCPFNASGDATATNAGFGALANNGGPTLTRLPVAGNSVIDHIPHASCVQHYDQRGYSRTPAVLPGSTNCDSGAVEVGGANDRIFYYDFD